MSNPMALNCESGMSRQTGWITGVRQGVSNLFLPTVITPTLPIRSVSLTSKEKGLVIAVATAETLFTYQGSEGGRSGYDDESLWQGWASSPRSPWCWPSTSACSSSSIRRSSCSGTGRGARLVHKTITGVLLILNLLMTQYAARRLGLLLGRSKAEMTIDAGARGLAGPKIRQACFGASSAPRPLSVLGW